MKKIMIEENDWDYMTEASVVQGLIEKVTYEEMITAMKAMKLGKAAGPSEVCAETISTSAKMGISVMMELCRRALDGKGMSDK